MSNTLLKRYDEIEREILELREEQKEIGDALERHVSDHGDLNAYGWIAEMKRGRSSINHEKAALDADVTRDVIEEHTTRKPTTKWAVITKQMKIDTDPYKTEGEMKFSISRSKN